MKYTILFSVFGKEMKASIEAPNEAEAREILLRKVREQVKINSARLSSDTLDQANGLNDLFKNMGIWQ